MSGNKIRLIGTIDEAMFVKFSKKLDAIDDLLQVDEHASRIVELEVNSGGGSTLDALAIASRIRTSKLHIKCNVHGFCASAAVIILASCDERRMAKEAWVMVHEDACKLSGQVTALETEVDFMRRLETQWSALLGEVTTTPATKWAELHERTTYLSAAQCLELGLIDEVV